MKFKNVGIDLDIETIINDLYFPVEREYVKVNKESNFNTGLISFEDGVFLPEGTFVLLKEDGKCDKIGKILHYQHYSQKSTDKKYSIAIVSPEYDMSLNQDISTLDMSLFICNIYKDIYGYHQDTKRKIQVIEIIEDEQIDNYNNCLWTFVKVIYGNKNTNLFYTYGWCHQNGTIHVNKDINSEILHCFYMNAPYIKVNKDEWTQYKIINMQYKIEPNIKFAPGELELYILCIILYCLTFIFKQVVFIWFVITVVMLIARKSIRKKYNK